MAKKTEVKVIEVIRTGSSVIVPENMSIAEAIDALMMKQREEEEITNFSERINAFPWDGALAMVTAMEELFGYASSQPTQGFFGPEPPEMMSVEVGVGQTKLVPWGAFKLPGIEGRVSTGFWKNPDGLIQFQITASVKKKNEPHIRRLAKRTAEIVAVDSIYRGKAIRIKFFDDDGDRIPIPSPTFLDLTRVNEEELIFSDDVRLAVETNLYAAIEYPEACRRHKIPLKRGILFSGPYGVGKTLCGYVAAKKAVDHGTTFIYCEAANELADAIRFAQQYAPAVLFCEDIDQSTSGERDEDMNEVLNVIDGIDAKNIEVTVVLTTNNVEKINTAMLRPGRIDALIEITPPDAKAVQKLLRLYGRGLIPADESLVEIGLMLDGTIPAVIGEVVEKAKLASVYLTKGAFDLVITEEALLIAAKSMQPQRDILEGKKVERFEIAPHEAVARGLASLMHHGNGKDEQTKVFVEDKHHGGKLYGRTMPKT